MEDSIPAHVDYATLDRPSNDVRIRLSSTAIRVKHLGDPLTAKEVEVTYLATASLIACAPACFNAIVPELPEVQKAALHMARLQKLGVSRINSPGMFFSSINLDIKSAWGGAYKIPKTPDDPMIIVMYGAPSLVEMRRIRPAAA